jgi:hypothetical protein
VLDQVEERLLSPLNVVEDDDERSGRLDQLAERPRDLFTGRQNVLAEKRADRLCDMRLHLDAGELLDDLDDRPVGDPLAVRKAATADDSHTGLTDQLGCQSRKCPPKVDARRLLPHQVAASRLCVRSPNGLA